MPRTVIGNLVGQCLVHVSSSHKDRKHGTQKLDWSSVPIDAAVAPGAKAPVATR